MNILYLNLDPGVPVFGTTGASVHVASMADALARHNHAVRVLARRPGRRSEVTHAAPVPSSYGAGPTACATFVMPPEDDRFRVAALPEDAFNMIRAVVSEWSPDFIYERYSLWGTEGVRVAREFSIPHLLEVNAPLPEEAYRYRDRDSLDRARDAARIAFRGAARIMTVSRELARYVAGYGVPADSIQILPNAVDKSLFEETPDEPEQASLRSGRAFTLGFCGSLGPWHGIDDLLRIFLAVRRRVPETRLVVVGDGPARERLEAGARAADAHRALVFTGAVEHGAVPGWLSTFDVALAPYPRLESFHFSPLNVLEYLAAGLPVVTSRQGDLPQLIRHGLTGLLYEPGDIEEAVSFVLALHSDRARAGRMGHRGRADVLAHHTWDARADAIIRRALQLCPGSRVA